MHNLNNFTDFILSLFFAICPVIPFAITDIYYGYHTYQCMQISIINNLSAQYWILVNGYMSLSSILFISIIFSIIYDNRCTSLVYLFQNTIFIKTYLFLKIMFNISWTIIGSFIFSNVYNQCPFNIQFYIWFRISIMFLFIILSLKNIKHYIVDQELEEQLSPHNVQ